MSDVCYVCGKRFVFGDVILVCKKCGRACHEACYR